MKKKVILSNFLVILFSLFFIQIFASDQDKIEPSKFRAITAGLDSVIYDYSIDTIITVYERSCPGKTYSKHYYQGYSKVGRDDYAFGGGDSCLYTFRGYLEFNTSNIPDNATIIRSEMRITHNTDYNPPFSIRIRKMEDKPSGFGSTPQTIWYDCGDGIIYDSFTISQSDTTCLIFIHSGSEDSLNAKIDSLLSANWFALGWQSNAEGIAQKFAHVRPYCNNPFGYSLKVVYSTPPPGGGGSCPFLYVWNGSDFEEDNTILTQTEFSAKEQTVTDYYQIQKSLVSKNNQYHLQLRELTNEESFIDRVELLTVDHPNDQKIAVTQEGKIFYTEEGLTPVTTVDDKGEDQLERLLAKDKIFYTSENTGSLELTFPNPENKSKKRIVFSTPTPSKIPGSCDQERPGGPLISPDLPREQKLELIKTEIQDINGNWIELAQAPPRDYYSLNYWLIDQNQIQLGATFKIRISWEKGYSADEIKFYTVTDQQPVANTYSPMTTSHSKAGSVIDLVTSQDSRFATLIKGEKLDLFFPANNLPLPEGYTRDFIVKASGYYIPYVPEPTASVPDKFELKDNYPNPFNATTEIRFALPQESDVKLDIYNITGQKVKTLFEGRKTAGVHKVTWDGKNDRGEVVASGVYLYTITTGAYSTTKKMTLLK